MILYQGNFYLKREYISALREEPEYVRKRYQAVARTLAPQPLGIIRKQAARMLGLCKRQIQRIVKRFRAEGIPGLRFKSRRPKNSPNLTPQEIETQVKRVREASGFGPNDIAVLMNESFRREGKNKKMWPSTICNILVRTGEIERERRLQKKWKFFEWGHPNRLIQADLTLFNGVPLLTMEDDHARHGWALALRDQTDKTVTKGMRTLIHHRYDNLLTDNGRQFSRKNAEIRKYCDDVLNEKHIWTSIHHPQTMGKLSAFQKALKRFLRHQLGGSRDRKKINYWIAVFVNWYNNGKYHSAIKTYPAVRYFGNRAETWYEDIVVESRNYFTKVFRLWNP